MTRNALTIEAVGRRANF